jgi:hypothetical protein
VCPLVSPLEHMGHLCSLRRLSKELRAAMTNQPAVVEERHRDFIRTLMRASNPTHHYRGQLGYRAQLLADFEALAAEAEGRKGKTCKWTPRYLTNENPNSPHFGERELAHYATQCIRFVRPTDFGVFCTYCGGHLEIEEPNE